MNYDNGKDGGEDGGDDDRVTRKIIVNLCSTILNRLFENTIRHCEHVTKLIFRNTTYNQSFVVINP